MLSASVSPSVGAEAGKLTLVRADEPRFYLVTAENPPAEITRAVREIRTHVGRFAGSEPEHRKVADTTDLAALRERHAGKIPVVLGGDAPSMRERLREAEATPDAFLMRVRQDGVRIAALSGEGVRNGAYDLLERMGVRWYMPGGIGVVLPDAATIKIGAGEFLEIPSIIYRRFQKVETGEWPDRMRMGGQNRPTGAHNLPGRGKARSVDGTEGGQICVSGDYNPGAIELTTDWIRKHHEATDEKVYVAMGPRDGGTYSYCRCDGCEALDKGVHDPFVNGESMTDRYIWFFNRVLEELEDDYPNLHITWYVYQRHMMPPERQPNPRIVPVFAPISLERVHSMDNPMAMDRQVLRWLLDRWAETGPNEMYYRGYLNFLASAQYPKTQLDRVRNDIPALHEKGVNVMRVEVIQQSWASDPLTLYVASKLMWDTETDVDALLEEFYAKFYGPAEEPMRAYHEGLESAFADNPYASGSDYIYFPLFLEHPRRDRLRGLLEEARSKVADGTVYAERIDMLRKGYKRMDLFLDMILARNRHDFAKAMEKMEVYEALTGKLTNVVLEGEGEGREFYEQRLVNSREDPAKGRAYFNRFFKGPMVAGHERTVEKGDLVARFEDEWLTRQDKQGIGEQLMFHRPGELGGIWEPMKTTSRTWGDQGLFHYRGDDAHMWYRQSVRVPEKFEGRPIYLWVGGVDTWAKVWINGEYVGTSKEPEEGLPGVPGSFRAFDMPASKAVRFGEENWVAMRVTNDKLGELGTGGIMGPVMFWSPKDSDWKPGK